MVGVAGGMMFYGPGAAPGPVIPCFPTSVEYLVVGGGGAGGAVCSGAGSGGGGGAGGFLCGTLTVPSITRNLEIHVGGGGCMGAGAPCAPGTPAAAPNRLWPTPGYSSRLSVPGVTNIVAFGGGGGGSSFGGTGVGQSCFRCACNGGSGGGWALAPGTTSTSSGTPGQGNNGGPPGRAPISPYPAVGGGGGGASQAGCGGPLAAPNQFGVGGNGCAWNGVTYAGGGGGSGVGTILGALGGSGGGGQGGGTCPAPLAGCSAFGNNGTNGLGGGGGGSGGSPGTTQAQRSGGVGGSGVVIVRYSSSFNAPAVTSGGVIGSTGGGYCCFTFTSDGNISWGATTASVDWLVVAGGGGGGGNPNPIPHCGGGGGGGGGFRTGTATISRGVTYQIGIGGGGGAMTSGSDSCFAGFRAGGGGRGGSTGEYVCTSGYLSVAEPGGSGGGRGATPTPGVATSSGCQGLGNQPSVSPSQGNPGASFVLDTASWTGGGGGAGGTGTIDRRPLVLNSFGGCGGAAIAAATFGFPSAAFSGGGGGGSACTPSSPCFRPGGVNAGVGGCGNTAGPLNGGDAVANRGGGGGGAARAVAGTANGGSGGSGFVAIRYADSLPAATTTGSPTSTTSGGFRVYCWTGSGSFTIPS